MTSRDAYLLDLGERVFWAVVEVISASVSVAALGLPDWAVMPVTGLMATLKCAAARHIGNSDTAAIGGPHG